MRAYTAPTHAHSEPPPPPQFAAKTHVLMVCPDNPWTAKNVPMYQLGSYDPQQLAFDIKEAMGGSLLAPHVGYFSEGGGRAGSVMSERRGSLQPLPKTRVGGRGWG